MGKRKDTIGSNDGETELREQISESEKAEILKVCEKFPAVKKLWETFNEYNEDPGKYLFHAYVVASKHIHTSVLNKTLSKELEFDEAAMQFCKDYKAYVQGGDLGKRHADVPEIKSIHEPEIKAITPETA